MITEERGRWYFTCKQCKGKYKTGPWETRRLAEFSETMHKEKSH